MSFQHPAQARSGVSGHHSTPYPTALAPTSFPSRPGTSTLIQHRRQLITFDMLPDDVLLHIFDSYKDEDIGEDIGPSFDFKAEKIQEWITLVHVCRRWRSVVFQSPHRLNLRLVCTPDTPARDTLDVWPPLPLIICGIFNDNSPRVDNIIAALEHNDRVCQIGFDYSTYSSSPLVYITDSSAMQRPFPELTHLHISIFKFAEEGPPIFPDSFLSGAAPRLRSLVLGYVPFPGLPKLLSSVTHLVKLDLYNIPRSGYIQPGVMATSLSVLTSLEFLRLEFRYPRTALETRRPHPPRLARSILPSLTDILFKGASEYLEVILARIDAPRLSKMDITFFNQILFDTPQLFQCINRSSTLRAPEKGHIEFKSKAVIVKFPPQSSNNGAALSVGILCTASEWQLSSLEQICTSSLPPISMLEDLYIFENRIQSPHWQDDVEDTLWLDFLRSFVAVKNIYFSQNFVPRIAPAMEELIGGQTTEVLPTLGNIFLEGPQTWGPQKGIQKFVAARRLTDRPVKISYWD